MRSTAKPFINTLMTEIRSSLQNARMRIDEEIGSYPAPIAGCDQPFNHLLAQRTAIKGELRRLEALGSESLPAEDVLRFIAEFIQASACLDVEAKAALGRVIQEHAGSRKSF